MVNYPISFCAKKYHIWSRLNIYKKRLNRAKDQIKKAFDISNNWYVACSAGKDSTVLAHLVNSINKNIEVWSIKDDLDFPGELEFITNIANKYNWNLKITIPKESLWQGLINLNIDINSDIHSRLTKFSMEFFYSLITIQEQLFDGVFLGLRKQESRARLMNFAKRGHLYKKKNNKLTSCPLSTWTGEDIFAYLVSNNIPIFDVYFKTLFHKNDPTRIRKSWIIPGASSRKGQAVWLKYYYPDLFKKVSILFPEINNYI